jgi:hypothetical protein
MSKPPILGKNVEIFLRIFSATHGHDLILLQQFLHPDDVKKAPVLFSYFPEPPTLGESMITVETDATLIERRNTGQNTMEPFFPCLPQKIFKHC